MDVKNRLGALDALRGFAALWVVLYHFVEGQHMPALMPALPRWLVVVFQAGHLGVAVFFVLSGVVMALTAEQVRLDGVNASRFVLRRLVRLWPPYAAALLLGLATLTVKEGLGESGARFPPLWEILAHLFFVQDIAGASQISIVFWTLCLEVQFYIVFAATLWLADRRSASPRAAAAWRLGAWCLWALIGALWVAGVANTALWRGGFMGLWYSFVVGALCGMALGPRSGTARLAGAYATFVLLCGWFIGNAFAAIAGATGLFVLLSSRWPALHGVLANSGLAWLGTVSYSLYLLHNAVTGISMRVFRKVFGAGLAEDALGLCGALAACIAAAWLMHRFVETAAIGWSRRVTFTATRKPSERPHSASNWPISEFNAAKSGAPR